MVLFGLQKPASTSLVPGNRCRCLFPAFLGLLAVVLGWTAHYHQARSEVELAENQFQAIAERAAFSVRETTLRSQAANVAVATLYANSFPDAEEWPFVSIERYNAIAEPISRTAAGDTGIGLGVAIFMDPDQVDDFNEFQADYLETYFGPAVPKRVYEFPAENRESPLLPSALNVSAPISQSFGAIAGDTIMLDLFTTSLFRTVIENHIQLAEDNADKEKKVQHGIFSDFVRNVPGRDIDAVGPSFYYTHPIYPVNNESTVVGMTISPISWNEVLRSAFRVDVSGIDCVIESSTNDQFSYSIRDGQPMYMGVGDLHRGGVHGDLTLEISLVDQQPKEDVSVSFRVMFYPSCEFYQAYASRNPAVAMLGGVAIMAFTSFLFFLYDCSVRKDMLKNQSVLEAKRNFMRFVSHEVRTPLNTVSMGLTVVREDIARLFETEKLSDASAGDVTSAKNISVGRQQAAELVKLTEEIHKNADRAVDILSDLLNYDKIECGKLSLERTVIHVWLFIENVVDEFRLASKSEAINLTLDLSSLQGSNQGSSSLPLDVLQHKVFGDSIRLAQVIRNLLSNALKFTPKGGDITVKVELLAATTQTSITPSEMEVFGREQTFPQSGTLQLSVTDNGVGMTKDQQKKLFGQGVQFNANVLQNGRGSGLGLSIAKGIIEHHGGKLEAFSEGLGQGSTFFATLPLYRIPDRSSVSPDPTKRPPSTRHLHASRHSESNGDSNATQSSDYHRALVVDDAPMNRKLLSRLLSNRGWDCDCAENGQLAVQMAYQAEQNGRPYDCILLDYEMPVMNGPEAACELRAAGCKSCLIGVTGNVLPRDVEYFIQCGVVQVFGKPVNINDVETLWRSKEVLDDLQAADELFG